MRSVAAFLLFLSLLVPASVLARGPSPAKVASRHYQKQGYFVTQAVTVYRNARQTFGVANLKIANGQVVQLGIDLKQRKVVSDRYLTGKANQLTALAAHRQGWGKGYVVENDPMGMLPAMTRRGNVRRFVVNYESDQNPGESIVVFNRAGGVKRVTMQKPIP